MKVLVMTFPVNDDPSARPGIALNKQYMKKDGMQMKRRRSSRKLIGCGLMSK
jgi:hypothetical protein